jgi:hypothetical protein
MGKFKGDLAGVLFETIVDYLSRDRTPFVINLQWWLASHNQHRKFIPN